MDPRNPEAAVSRGASGEWVEVSCQGEAVRAFVPTPLPPSPAVRIEGALRRSLDGALLALGRLDGVTTLLPDAPLFVPLFVRKEAVLSCQLAGVRATLLELLLFGLDPEPGGAAEDVQAVSCCVAALEHGLRRLREGLPISSRLVREIHGRLLARAGGADRQPGELRTQQSWMGGPRPGLARYVPPPPAHVPECMKELERFVHEPAERLPALVKTALAHAQLETIHPFVDGNGRLARLLTTLLLWSEGVLGEPLLPLSLYFGARRREYDDLLQRVRRDGDWEAWLQFFSDAVRQTAEGALVTARRIAELVERDRWQVQGRRRSVGSALRVLRELQQRPVGSIPRLVDTSGLSAPRVRAALRKLEGLRIVRPLEGPGGLRVFVYDRYLALLEEGTKP
ncbi:MAG: Fic family protein [Myxococcota bacterium]